MKQLFVLAFNLFIMKLSMHGMVNGLCGSSPETEGRFGLNCSEVCSCSSLAVCDDITGECTGRLCGNIGDTYTCDKNNLSVVVIKSFPIAMEMESVVITCITNLGTSDINVVWRGPAGGVILPGPKYEMRSDSDAVNVLVVRNVASDDSGSYSCVANLKVPTTQLSAVEESVNITVYARGKIFQYPMPVIKKESGERFQLVCQAFFELSSPSLQWLFNSQVIKNDESASLSNSTQYFTDEYIILIRTLDVRNVTKSHNGTYSCIASRNNIQTDMRKVDVFIVDIPRITNPQLAGRTSESLLFSWQVVDSGNDWLTCTISGTSGAPELTVKCSESTSCNVTNLSPFTIYDFSIVCQNHAGSSDILVYENVQTEAAAPDSPPVVHVEESATQCNITWTEPIERNGPGNLHYTLQQIITQREAPEEKAQIISENIGEKKSIILEKADLSSNSIYSFEVSAGNDIHNSAFMAGSSVCTTPRSTPDNIPDLQLLDENAVTSDSVKIRLPKVDTRNGPISCYEFVVIETNVTVSGSPDEDVLPDVIRNEPSENGSPYRAIVLAHVDVTRAKYITIGGESLSSTCYLNTMSNKGKRSTQEKELSLRSSNNFNGWSIGSGSHRYQRSMPWDVNDTLIIATNEPLIQDTQYAIFLRTFTILDDGSIVYISSRYLNVTTTKAGSGMLFIIMAILLVFILLAMILALIIWRSRRKYFYKKEKITNRDDATYMNEGYSPSSYLSLPNYYSAATESLSYMPMKPKVSDAVTTKDSQLSTEQPVSTAPPVPTTERQSRKDALDFADNRGISNAPDLVFTTLSDPGQGSESASIVDTYMFSEGKPANDSSGMLGSRSGISDISMDEKDDYECAVKGHENMCADGPNEMAFMEQEDVNDNGIVHTYFEDEDYEDMPAWNAGSNEEQQDYSTELYGDWTERTCTKVSKLAEYIKERKRLGPGSLKHEFFMLPQGQQETWNVAIKRENVRKNSFPNILPYDYTRVKLPKLPGDPFSDYYNASFITDQFNKTNYIAAQGPSADTVADFWRMIWSERIQVVVTVNTLEDGEEGKIACHQDWPNDSGEVRSFGSMTVQVESMNTFAHYQVRKLQLQNETGEEALSISQFIFLSWPCQLKTPRKQTPLLSFMKMVKHAQRSSRVPILVSCSDGAGITGTFLAVYCLMDDLPDESEISVFEFVKRMRKNRIGMVQSEEQYIFIYDALLEEYQTPKTDLTVTELLALEEDAFQREFQILQNTPSQQSHDAEGTLERNMAKNRFPDKVPKDEYRPVLSSESLMRGNDYINASFADSFFKTDAFILTQSPLPTTVEDFWRLVLDYRCTKIIALNKIDGSDKRVPFYWPRGGTVQYGSITVESMESQEPESEWNTRRRFSVSHVNHEEKLTVEQWDMSSWDQTSDVTPNLRVLLDELVHSYDGGHVLIHCLDGSSSSGVFLIVLHQLQRLQGVDSLDVYEAVRTLQASLPFALRKEDEYFSIYKILKRILSDTSW